MWRLTTWRLQVTVTVVNEEQAMEVSQRAMAGVAGMSGSVRPLAMTVAA